MAQVSFNSVWLSTAVNQAEESQSFAGSKIAGATGISFTSQDPNAVTFSGNNVPGDLKYTLNGVTYTVQGIVSRLFKSGNTYEGFYFVEAGSDYALTSQELTKAYILVWPSRDYAFAQSPGTYSTSSDPVDSALNALYAAQPTLIGITQNEADLTLDVGQTWLYTINFSADIDAATFTTSDLQNVGTAGVTFGTLTEISPGVFTLQVTANSTGTVKLAIVNGTGISSPTGYAVSTSPQIVDDETLTVTAPVVPVVKSVVAEDASTPPGSGDSTVVEGGTLRYTITLSAAGTSPTQFSLGAGGTASPTDYSGYTFSNGVTYDPATGKITVPAGVTSFTVTVPTVDDTLVENTETLSLTVGGLSATGTILDNDVPPVTVNNISVNEASPYAVFTVTGTAGQSVSLALQNDADAATKNASLGADAGTALQYFNGTAWVNYSGGSVVIPAGGQLLVRNAIVNDLVYEGAETYQLAVTPAGGTTALGTATILDDGTGNIYPNNNTGAPDPTALKDDDRPLQVNNILVNEGSPYAVFSVTATAGQSLSLTLQNDSDSATADATLGTDAGTALEYFNGSAWVSYAGGQVTVPAGGTLLVRTTVSNDSTYEGAETFQLKVSPSGGSAAVGTATIVDDGSGNIYPNNNTGNPDPVAPKDDDRGVAVNSIEVNEASPFAVFTVSGSAGQSVSLALQNDSNTQTNHATLGTDTGTALQYFDGSVWVNYTGGQVTLPAGGKLLVRTTVIQDTVYESPETFKLAVTPTGGVAAFGTATILDDGTGNIYPNNNTGTPDPNAAKDDDRAVQVDDILVNEASPYAVFSVQGAAGQALALTLQNDNDPATANATLGVDSGTRLQYFNGLGWADYTGGTVNIPANGVLLVRTTVVNDSTYEGAEALQLKVTPTGGTTVYGTATIVDDGTGNVYPDNTTGNRDPDATLDDDRAIKVNDIDVNERSPYGVFTVTANAGQMVTLGLQNDSDPATADATLGVDTGTQLQYYNGSAWVNYVAGTAVAVPASGQMMVRLSISNGPDYEGPETFQLSVSTSGGLKVYGTATIYDDGTGTIYNLDGTPNLVLTKDDDRTVKVSDILVNEASPYAVFTVTGAAGLKVTLGLQNDTDISTADATLGTDSGTALEYFDGTAWQPYVAGASVTLPTSGQLLVRTTVVNDSTYEGAEALQLVVKTAGGNTSYGTATIIDDGTGNIYPNNNTGATDPAAPRDDDRPITVSSVEVNEASPYTIFTVTATAGRQLTLQTADGTAVAADYGSTLEYSSDNGRTWQAYASTGVTTPASGSYMVRVPVKQDTLPEGQETFTLKATGGTQTQTGTGTIRDDGQGAIFKPDGTLDLNAVKDDDRPLAVNNIEVNEASPYAVFHVSGQAGQLVTLALQNDNDPATANATLGTDAGNTLQYFNGSAWVAYTGAAVAIAANGELLVRNTVTNDSTFEGAETYQLTATPTGGTAATGTATILDDGTGNIYPDNNTGSPDSNAIRDDDRAVKVSDIEVNEASPYAVFTVSGTGGQTVTLALKNDSDPTTANATLGTDAGTGLEYFNGSAWVPYTGGAVTLPADGQLLVRNTVTNDSTFEGAETYQLQVTPTGGSASTGTATIFDDGTGNIYPNNNNTGNPDPDAPKDDDRAVQVNDIAVNEASPYAVFTVSGTAGQRVSLGLQNDSDPLTSDARLGTDAGVQLEYFDGSNWVYYIGGTVALPANGQLLVRNAVINDSVYEGPEAFQLKVTTTGGSTVAGTATIYDDGTGNIYPNNNTGNPDPNATKDDDRSVKVGNIDVNEASPYAVFTVSGAAGQSVTLALQNDSDPDSANTTLGTDAGTALEYFNGTAWVPYTGGAVTLPANGQLLVRNAVINDSTYEGAETYQLKVSLSGGAASYGTATIHDDGTGNIYPSNNTTGNPDPDAPKDDDRALHVSDVLVNEASPYAVFTVSGAAGQAVSLGLQNDSNPASANATLSVDAGVALEYFDGTDWAPYNGGTVNLPASGELLVRTTVTNDSTYEGAETFQLKAVTTGGLASYGTATIYDDGTGNIYPNNPTGNPDPNAIKDDDRSVKVNNIEVNEASPYAVFTIGGAAGQNVSLALQNDSDPATANATLGTDAGTALEYFNGSAWVPYTGGTVTLPASGQLLVRTPVTNDAVYEGAETFELKVTPSGGVASYGTATILDDGTGDIYPNNNTGATDPAAVRDDDRAVQVNSVDVNEASPYAVFTVKAQAGQQLALGLQEDNDLLSADAKLGTDTGTQLQYFDGSNWVNYTSGTVATPASGTLLVRVAVVNDSVYEGPEAFLLRVSNTAGTSTYGTGTIHDDGTGVVFNNQGQVDPNAPRDDDRPAAPTPPAPTPITPTPPTTTAPPTPTPPTPPKAPVIGGLFETSIPEGTRPVTQLSANEPVSWNVEPGEDGALFKVDANGKLKFSLPPDYERPLDVGTDNTYTFTVKATNSAGASTLQKVTVHVTDVSPGLPVYFSDTTSNTDRMLFTAPAKADETDQVQFFRTERTDAQTLPLKAWFNPLTGDWFYGVEGVAPPYDCYVERPDVVLGRVLKKDQGSFNVHTYLNDQGNTQIVSETAAENLGLLAKGYRDLGASYQFASADETATLVGMLDLSQLG